MDLAFVVSLPSDVERFEAVARRLPGSNFVLAPGRWPSPWLDSHRWTLQKLRERRWSPAPARRQFSLLVAAPGVPARALSKWAAPGARLLRLAAGDPRFGDPRLDAAFEIGAAMRARRALGLSPERPLIVVPTHEPERHLRRLAPALSPLRAQAELLLVPSESAWLRSPRPLPRALHGPGIAILREGIAWAELLAAADCVIGDDLAALCDALRLRRPALLLHEVPHSAPQFQAVRGALELAASLLPVVLEPEALHAAVGRLHDDWSAIECEQRAALARLRDKCRGNSSARLAAAIARAHARVGIDRVLRALR